MISAKDELKHVADTVSEQEAEVYLAAPDLLEACLDMLKLLKLLGPSHDTGPTAEQMRDAVERATGQRP